MKKSCFAISIVFLIVLLLAPAPSQAVSAISPSQAKEVISKEEALPLAEEAGRQHQLFSAGFTISDIRANLAWDDKNQKPLWFITFHTTIDINPYFIITLNAQSGEFLDINIFDTNINSLIAYMNQWKAEKGNISFWSLEDQALFSAIIEPSDYPSPHVLPLPEHISQEAATVLAKKTILENFSISEKELENHAIGFSFSQGLYPDFNGPSEPISQEELARYYRWTLLFFESLADGSLEVRFQIDIDALNGKIIHAEDLHFPSGLG